MIYLVLHEVLSYKYTDTVNVRVNETIIKVVGFFRNKLEELYF